MKALVLLLALLAFGCTSCLKDGSSAVSNLSGTVGYTPSTGMWSAGITISFKSPPKPDTVRALTEAVALRVNDLQWQMPAYKWNDKKQSKALAACYHEGATVIGYKP